MRDDDALDLWRAFGVSGARGDLLLPLFRTFDNHPLLIQALGRRDTSAICRAPGNFDRWQQDHPTFNPFDLPLSTSDSLTCSRLLCVNWRILAAEVLAYNRGLPHASALTKR